jgi:hypothetical protein
VWLNVLYLFPLCLVPFGASLIANHQKDPVALRLYGFLLVFVALTRRASGCTRPVGPISSSFRSIEGRGASASR